MCPIYPFVYISSYEKLYASERNHERERERERERGQVCHWNRHVVRELHVQRFLRRIFVGLSSEFEIIIMY